MSKEVILEISEDQLCSLHSLCFRDSVKHLIPYDLQDILIEAWNKCREEDVDTIIDNTELVVKQALHRLLEPVLYKYKMAESTDPEMINLVLSLEQHLEDY